MRAAGCEQLAFCVDAAHPVEALRVAVARLRARDAGDVPIVLRHRRRAGASDEESSLRAGLELGAPLADGIGDAIALAGFADAAAALDLGYRVLQGARQRTTRTEFISCPSCGRTLFDLEEVTARIKARTEHLPGVKIAVMGCIVNGPGEMADADFGYVGSGPGTVNLFVGHECVERHVPTPEATDLFRTLRRMRDAGARAVAMEVSSHALELGRVRGLGFDLALFTNLSRDHFDFHAGFEAYYEAKRSLFAQLRESGVAVVNVGDPYGRRLAAELSRVVTYGPGGDVSCEDAELDRHGIRARLATPRGPLRITSRLLGSYNLENLMAAAAAGEALGLPHATIAEGLAARGPLPGRMEPVDAGQPFPALVDFAHTDAALEAAIRSLRELSGDRVIVVFGCGGDRDPGKRALMGRVAGELADLAIATSDNPRGEDPMAILSAVEEGLRQSGNRDYRLLPDRREAIRQAVAKAGPGWAVLVAGKGHEEVQIVGDRRLPFSDRAELRQALEERFGAGTTR